MADKPRDQILLDLGHETVAVIYTHPPGSSWLGWVRIFNSQRETITLNRETARRLAVAILEAYPAESSD